MGDPDLRRIQIRRMSFSVGLRRPALGWAFALIAALLTFVNLAGPAVARPLDEVKDSGFLRVIVYTDFKPFSWEENGKVVGINADLGRAIARELGVKPKIIARGAGEEVGRGVQGAGWAVPRSPGFL